MTEDSQLGTFLAVGAAAAPAGVPRGESFRKAEFSLTGGTIEVPEDAPEGKALNFLEQAGQNPDLWEVTGFRRIEYGRPEEPMISTRFTYRRRPGGAERVDIDDLLAMIHEHGDRPTPAPVGEVSVPGAAILIGDMQFGQGIDDPFEAIENTLEAIDAAADEVERQGGAEELLIAWLGDHIEGITSQGGKNIWRTKLTLNEQIRATRRVMYYAIERLHPLTDRLVMIAVPGNHGRVESATGAGTRADDNHDVEALNAVAEALSFSGIYSDVEILVPEQDEISLQVKVGGVNWAAVHGEKWAKNKHWDWWKSQSFHGRPSAGADVLVCGHWHTFIVEEEGQKLFIQVQTLGTDGKWWEHKHGAAPNQGLVLAITNGEKVEHVAPIHV